MFSYLSDAFFCFKIVYRILQLDRAPVKNNVA